MSTGEPDDVPGECNARLYIGDNFADNHATMRCSLEKGHEGLHFEKYKSQGSGKVIISWENHDETEDRWKQSECS